MRFRDSTAIETSVARRLLFFALALIASRRSPQNAARLEIRVASTILAKAANCSAEKSSHCFVGSDVTPASSSNASETSCRGSASRVNLERLLV